MLPSRKLTRREFMLNFPLMISAAKSADRVSVPARKFDLGQRVITKRYCDDYLSDNYGGINWESGVIVGYCWQYDEWNSSELSQGWSYFIKFDSTNQPNFYPNPWLDFKHETRLERV